MGKKVKNKVKQQNKVLCTAKEAVNQLKEQPIGWKKMSINHLSVCNFKKCIRNSYNSVEDK